MSDLLSVKDVATQMGYTEQYIRDLIRKGDISAERVGRSWVVPQTAVEAYSSTQSVAPSDKARSSGKIKNLPICLSFFSGAMGLDLGLESAGFEILLASEIDEATRRTILKNRPNIALLGDMLNYSAEDIRAAAGLSEEQDIDLIVGGPPCQAFSTAGKRQGFADKRGNVFLSFVDLIIQLNPKYAVIENVRGLLSAPLRHRPHNKRGFGFPPSTPDEEKGGALNHIVSKLRSHGFGVSFNLYNAANFGSPQKRERVVLVCSRDGTRAPYLTPTHSENGEFGLTPWRTVREVFMGLDSVKHEHVNFPEKRLQYYRMLKSGQYWKDLPEELQKKALGASYYAGGGKTGFLRRLDWDKPSPTLVTHPAMPATDLCHPSENRPLSIQEYKRIQEFPDDWVIMGKITDQYRQIGNAVPISLGRAIGKLIRGLLEKSKITEYSQFPYSRYQETDDISWMQSFLRHNAMAYDKNQTELALSSF